MNLNCSSFNKKGEDNRLNNWKKWLEVRKKFHDRMYQIQKREPCELCLNSGDHCREITEQKTLLEYAKIPEVDPSRGKPTFFSLPVSSKKFPSLISVQPKKLDYEIPEMEFVRVPTEILQEKDVLCDDKQKPSAWFENEYLIQQRKELSNKIKEIIPHIPQTAEMIVKGISPEKKTDIDSFETVQEVITYTDDLTVESESEYSKGSLTGDAPIKSLQIENAIFTADGSQEIKQCAFFLEYEIGKDNILEETITFKNIGNVVIKYFWNRQFPEKVLQNILPHRLPPYGFIFCKNESVILPGHTKEIKITFKANKPGVFKEIWKLTTVPDIFDGKIIKGQFFLILYACAEIANFAESEAMILHRIEEGMKYSVGKSIYNYILEQVNKIEKKSCIQRTDMTEKDKFEAINVEFGPYGTMPLIYHYDENLVKKLKCMYNKLTTGDNSEPWNYNLSEIRKLINDLKSQEAVNKYIFSFEEICSLLLRTRMIENEKRDLYQTIYDLLCIMFDEITERVYDLRKYHCIYTIETIPGASKEELLRQEYLDDNCRSRFLFEDLVIQKAAKRIEECKIEPLMGPPMEQLKLIPTENVDEKYKIYFKEKYNIDVDAVAKKGKGKGKDKKGKKDKGKKDKGKKDKKGKGKDKGKKDKKEKKEVKKPAPLRKDDETKSLSITDLEIPEEINYPSVSQRCPEEDTEFSPDDRMSYYQNLYTTIYLLLRQTVDEIETVMEHQKKSIAISRRVLRNRVILGLATTHPDDEYEEEESDVSSDLTASLTKTRLTDISKSYSEIDQDFFKPVSSKLKIVEEEVEMVDAQTETEFCSELFPPKKKEETMQTEGDPDKFDLVAQIERQLSATSVQYINTPKEDKDTQADLCTDCGL